ncbi:MAG: hypothetical protein MO853_00400 [Candidatus Protistobacter heckmanni]|nr:hypothetical protein [Candidatus Protistobacter heckmanni]
MRISYLGPQEQRAGQCRALQALGGVELGGQARKGRLVQLHLAQSLQAQALRLRLGQALAV